MRSGRESILLYIITLPRNLIFERDTLHLRVEKLEEIYIIEK